MRDVIMGALDQLRYEPTEKRIRAAVDGRTVVDSTRAVLVWEPRRVVPSYAVPAEDVAGELPPAAAAPVTSDAAILHPGIPFAAHSTPGTVLTATAAGERGEAAAFRPDDPDLAGHVILDFRAFDAWYEEEEPLVGHPRDPFHRVDVTRASRRVRIELDGQLLAESTRPRLVFETHLPLRFYLPREDVRADLRPSTRRTLCAYKGQASYWSVDVGHRGRQRPRLELRGPAARRRRPGGPGGVLRRPGRRVRGRRTPPAAEHGAVPGGPRRGGSARGEPDRGVTSSTAAGGRRAGRKRVA
jgi:uncharacterized protein (DUF427 family)